MDDNHPEDDIWNISAPQFHDFGAEESGDIVDNADGFFGERRRSSHYLKGSLSNDLVGNVEKVASKEDAESKENTFLVKGDLNTKITLDKIAPVTREPSPILPERRPLTDINRQQLSTPEPQQLPTVVNFTPVQRPLATTTPLSSKPQNGVDTSTSYVTPTVPTIAHSEADRNPRGRESLKEVERKNVRPRRSASPGGSRLFQGTQSSSAKTASVRSRSFSPVPSRPRSNSSTKLKNAAQPPLTVPMSPALKSDVRAKSRDHYIPKMSSTSRELQQIRAHLEKLKVDKKKAEVLRQQAVVGARGLSTVARSTKPLTMPTEPLLRTSLRAHVVAPSRPVLSAKAAGYIPAEELIGRSKHQHDLTGTSLTIPHLTEPKPFQLATGLRAKQKPTTAAPPASEGSSTPLAEKVMKFQTKTPHRFHTKPVHNAVTTPPDTKPLSLTIPHTPQLNVSRPRPRSTLSFEEKEEQIMNSIKPFKARPVNPKILHSSGELGVPKVPKAHITEPEPFELLTDRRAELKPKAIAEEEYMTHEDYSSYTTKQHPSITVPQSPALETKARAAVRSIAPADHEELPHFKARPLPRFDGPKLPAVPSKELVIPHSPQMPGLARHKMYKQRFDEMVAVSRKIEHDRMLFKARPMCISEPPAILPSERELTEVEPFHMASEILHERAQAELKAKMDAESQKLRLDAIPRARPMIDLNKVFVPQKSTKPLTEVEPPQLATELQSEKRTYFDKEQERRRQEAEMARQREMEERKLREDEELKRLRREELVFKAQPVNLSAGRLPQVPQRELTIPESPALMTKSRSVMRSALYTQAS